MRFRYSHASELNHISYVCVEHLGKHFSALSKLREGDEFSKFTGCRFAEQKAEIKAVKYELQLEKQKVKELENFVKAIKQYKIFNAEDPSTKAMFRQLNMRRKKILALKKEIAERENALQESFKSQDDYKIKQSRLNDNEEK